MTTDPTPVTPAPVAEDRTTAIVAYLTLIGFIVAVILHGNRKTRLGAYHLRQALGLTLTAIAAMVASAILGLIPFIGWVTDVVIWVGIFVMWLLGLIAAASGQLKPVPLLGEYYDKWFARTFD